MKGHKQSGRAISKSVQRSWETGGRVYHQTPGRCQAVCPDGSKKSRNSSYAAGER